MNYNYWKRIYAKLQDFLKTLPSYRTGILYILKVIQILQFSGSIIAHQHVLIFWNWEQLQVSIPRGNGDNTIREDTLLMLHPKLPTSGRVPLNLSLKIYLFSCINVCFNFLFMLWVYIVHCESEKLYLLDGHWKYGNV